MPLRVQKYDPAPGLLQSPPAPPRKEQKERQCPFKGKFRGRRKAAKKEGEEVYMCTCTCQTDRHLGERQRKREGGER